MTLTPFRRARGLRRGAFTLLEVLVVVAILVALAGVASIYVFRYLDDSKKDKAKLDIRAIDHAVKAYSLRYDNPPEQLAQLLQPPDGGKPFLEGGAAAITDPWGRPYTYSAAGGVGAGGEPQPIISCQPPDGSQPISNVGGR